MLFNQPLQKCLFIFFFVPTMSLPPGTVLKESMDETATTASTVDESDIRFNFYPVPFSSSSKNDNLQSSFPTSNTNHEARRLNGAADSLILSIPIASSSTSLSSMTVGLSETGEHLNFQNVLAFPTDYVQSLPPPPTTAAAINPLASTDNSGFAIFGAGSLPSSSTITINGAGSDFKKIRPIEKKNGKVHKSVDLSRSNSLRSSSVLLLTGGMSGAQLTDAMEISGISTDTSSSSTLLSLIYNVGLSDVDGNIHNICNALAFSGGNISSTAALKDVDYVQSLVSTKNLSTYNVVCLVQMIIHSYLFHLLLLICYCLCFGTKNTIDNVNAVRTSVIFFSCCTWNYCSWNEIRTKEVFESIKSRNVIYCLSF